MCHGYRQCHNITICDIIFNNMHSSHISHIENVNASFKTNSKSLNWMRDTDINLKSSLLLKKLTSRLSLIEWISLGKGMAQISEPFFIWHALSVRRSDCVTTSINALRKSRSNIKISVYAIEMNVRFKFSGCLSQYLCNLRSVGSAVIGWISKQGWQRKKKQSNYSTITTKLIISNLDLEVH